MKECLKEAFLATDEQIKGSLNSSDRSGSTAAVVVIKKETGKTTLFSANIGDARTVLWYVSLLHSHFLVKVVDGKFIFLFCFFWFAAVEKERQCD
jgi:hypothetical protein